MRVKSGVKLAYYFIMNSQFKPFHRSFNVGDSTPLVPGSRGSAPGSSWFSSILKAQENPF